MRSRGSAWVPLAWALLPLVFFAVFFAWPVGSMVGRGLFPGGSPDLSALPEVLGRGRTLRVLGFTVGMALAERHLNAVHGDDLVDHAAGEQRSGYNDERTEHRGHKENCDLSRVGPGKAADSAEVLAGEHGAVVGAVLIFLAKGSHHGERCHSRLHGPSSLRLEQGRTRAPVPSWATRIGAN